MGNAIEELKKNLEEIANDYLEEVKNDLIEAANETNDLYFKQVNRMYDAFVEQYYKYKTSSYIRHWEGRPGTRKGSNLFYGKNFKIHRGKDPYFEINIDAHRMANDYQHDSATQVLENVMHGIRGVPPYWVESWSGSYKSRYLDYEGEPAEAFEEFLNSYEKKAEPVFLRRYRKIRGNKDI